MKARNELSADGLLRRMRQGFERIANRQPMNVTIALPDALMSGLALFALKDSSLLAFDERRAAPRPRTCVRSLGSRPCRVIRKCVGY